jgi:hypothetical protein
MYSTVRAGRTVLGEFPISCLFFAGEKGRCAVAGDEHREREGLVPAAATTATAAAGYHPATAEHACSQSSPECTASAWPAAQDPATAAAAAHHHQAAGSFLPASSHVCATGELKREMSIDFFSYLFRLLNWF